MRKIKVLFLAADPLSSPPFDAQPPLQIDRDIREIQQRVGTATNPDVLEFEWRVAVRPQDLIAALNRSSPMVVHFSGHCGQRGLALDRDHPGGEPSLVSEETLVEIFTVFRGKIRLVVLNACLSLPQAEAVAGIVGCAIGMRRQISDDAAIVFGSAFYGAIACGHSIDTAFCLARAELRMVHPHEADCPVLVAPRVDPRKIVLVRRPLSRLGRRLRMGFVGMALAAVPIAGFVESHIPLHWRWDCGWPGKSTPFKLHAGPWTATAWPPGGGGNASGPQAALASAKALRAAGRHVPALPLFREAAEAKIPEAMGYFGIVLLHGEGTHVHVDSGMYWLREAAKKDDLRGMTALADAYLSGEAGAPRPSLADHWYSKAAKHGWPAAIRGLARMARDAGNFAQAIALYHDAIRAGSVDARIDVGHMYEEGAGFEVYPAEARCLYQKAADAGSATGLYELGRTHEEAVGVPRDLEKARTWYRAAADSGSTEAMNALGRLYEKGRGVKQNLDMAARWYRRARSVGSRTATGHLQAIGAF